jgi:hypothetical protein
VTVPANITVQATTMSSVPVSYTGQSASDIVSGPLTPSCSPASGSPFPIGTTPVTCTATDAKGNVGSASFTVTVNPPPVNFTVTPTSMVFQTGRLAMCNGIPVAVGPNWKDQGLLITNTGGTTLNYSLSTATGWLRLPVAGSLAPGASRIVTVSVNISGLSHGTHSGSFVVNGNGILAKTVPVTVTIGNAKASLCVTPLPVKIGKVKANKKSGTVQFTVSNVGDEPFDAQALADLVMEKTQTDGVLDITLVGYTPNSVTIALSVKAGKKTGAQQGSIKFRGSHVAQGLQGAISDWTVD